jgi:hypothetical protein
MRWPNCCCCWPGGGGIPPPGGGGKAPCCPYIVLVLLCCVLPVGFSLCVGELEPLPMDPSALVLDCDQGDFGRPQKGRKSHVIPRGV